MPNLRCRGAIFADRCRFGGRDQKVCLMEACRRGQRLGSGRKSGCKFAVRESLCDMNRDYQSHEASMVILAKDIYEKESDPWASDKTC